MSISELAFKTTRLGSTSDFHRKFTEYITEKNAAPPVMSYKRTKQISTVSRHQTCASNESNFSREQSTFPTSRSFSSTNPIVKLEFPIWESAKISAIKTSDDTCYQKQEVKNSVDH